MDRTTTNSVAEYEPHKANSLPKRERPPRRFRKTVALVAGGLLLMGANIVDGTNDSSTPKIQSKSRHEAVAPRGTQQIPIEVFLEQLKQEEAQQAEAQKVQEYLAGIAAAEESARIAQDEAARQQQNQQIAEPIDAPANNGVDAYSQDYNRQLGRTMALAYGYDEANVECLVELWDNESSWEETAQNPSGAGGIPQSLPMSKMASHGEDWATNPATQIAWGLDYISGRYGTACSALDEFYAKGWY